MGNDLSTTGSSCGTQPASGFLVGGAALSASQLGATKAARGQNQISGFGHATGAQEFLTTENPLVN